jgi:hypothetical protein
MAEYKGKLVSKGAFLKTAKPLSMTLADGQTVVCEPRIFSSGKVGYFGFGKNLIAGERAQTNVSHVIIGSDQLPD